MASEGTARETERDGGEEAKRSSGWPGQWRGKLSEAADRPCGRDREGRWKAVGLVETPCSEDALADDEGTSQERREGGCAWREAN